MIYVSDVIGKPVMDPNGERVARVGDLIVAPQAAATHPPVAAILVRTATKETATIPVSAVKVLVGPAVILARPLAAIDAFDAGGALWLGRDVLDKEIIDIDDARVVRVNDLELVRVNGSFYVANAIIGGLAFLRRIGLAHLGERVARAFGRTATVGAISWEHVELLPGAEKVRLRTFGGKATDLAAADVADIISELNRSDSREVVDSMNIEQLADTLEEVEPDFQASLVESMTDEKVADVLEEMAPDEAADLLAELPDQRSEDLLNLMHEEEAADVRKLLAYAENSAGGLMTTDVVTIRPDLTAGQTIDHLRRTAQEAETIYYIYVTDDSGHLLGVVSLQSVVLAQPNTPIADIMHDRVVSVTVDSGQDELAQLVAKYNLLAVPVVDDQNRLQGIVTADDAIDQIIPATWKKRLPRLYG
jgi:magnesium transporter